jgi:DNA-binding transcriptional LysR family regulator
METFVASSAPIDLNQIGVFVRVVDSGREPHRGRGGLRLPRSSVSRKLAALEESLGTRLLHRTTVACV